MATKSIEVDGVFFAGRTYFVFVSLGGSWGTGVHNLVTSYLFKTSEIIRKKNVYTYALRLIGKAVARFLKT